MVTRVFAPSISVSGRQDILREHLEIVNDAAMQPAASYGIIISVAADRIIIVNDRILPLLFLSCSYGFRESPAFRFCWLVPSVFNLR